MQGCLWWRLGSAPHIVKQHRLLGNLVVWGDLSPGLAQDLQDMTEIRPVLNILIFVHLVNKHSNKITIVKNDNILSEQRKEWERRVNKIEKEILGGREGEILS